MKNRMMSVGILLIAIFLIAGCSTSPEQKVLKAKKELSYGNLTKAELIFAEAIKTDSTGGTFKKYEKGLIAEYNGLEWEALFAYLDAAPGGGGFFPAMDDFTRLALKHDYLANGLQMARLIIKHKPESPKGYLYAADYFSCYNMADSVREYIDKASSKGADKTAIVLAKVKNAVKNGNDKEIIHALRLLSQTDFNSADDLSAEASIFHSLYMGDSAVFYARKAVDREKKNIYYRLQLAQYLLDSHRSNDAWKEVDHVLKTAEKCGRAYLLGAFVKQEMGDPDSATLLLSSFIAPHRRSAEGQERQGDFLLFAKNRSGANTQFQMAYTMAGNLKYPDDYITYLFDKLENSMLEQRDIPSSYAYFKEATDRFPDLSVLKFYKAELMLYFKDVVDSSKFIIDSNLQKNWANSYWLSRASTYYFRSNRFDQAARVYRHLLEFPQPKVEYVQNLLDIYAKKKNYAAADTLAQTMPFRFKHNLGVIERLRDIYAQAGDFSKAIQEGEVLYRQSDQYLPYLKSLAELYVKNKQIDKARQLYMHRVEQFPDNPESYYLLARFDFDYGQNNNVMENIQKAVQLDSLYSPALELQGMLYWKNGETDSALTLFRKAIAKRIQSPYAYYYMAKYLIQKKDSLIKAEGLARAAEIYFRGDRRGYLILGNAYWAERKFKLAKSQYARGSEAYPEDAELRFLLGRTLFKLKKQKEAKQALKKALQLGLTSSYEDEAKRILRQL